MTRILGQVQAESTLLPYIETTEMTIQTLLYIQIWYVSCTNVARFSHQGFKLCVHTSAEQCILWCIDVQIVLGHIYVNSILLKTLSSLVCRSHLCRFACIYMRLYVCLYMCVFVCLDTCSNVCIYIYIYIYIYIHVCRYARIPA